MPLARGLLVLLLALLPQAVEVPPASGRHSTASRTQLAKGGRERESKQLFDALAELGMPKAALGKLQTAARPS